MRSSASRNWSPIRGSAQSPIGWRITMRWSRCWRKSCGRNHPPTGSRRWRQRASRLGRCMHYDEVFTDPHILAREMVARDRTSCDRNVPYAGCHGQTVGHARSVRLPAPRLGEHTAEILGRDAMRRTDGQTARIVRSSLGSCPVRERGTYWRAGGGAVTHAPESTVPCCGRSDRSARDDRHRRRCCKPVARPTARPASTTPPASSTADC